jgi:DNA-binding NarL/FixJ family response regulator
MRVLIVEDEALVAMHLEMLLVDLGHEVCAVAACGRDAIAHASTHRPDVVLVDIRLAVGSSGIVVAREVHARHGLRCIFLSGNLDEATWNAVLPYEPIAFVGKPILPIQLQRALDNVAPTADRISRPLP